MAACFPSFSPASGAVGWWMGVRWGQGMDVPDGLFIIMMILILILILKILIYSTCGRNKCPLIIIQHVKVVGMWVAKENKDKIMKRRGGRKSEGLSIASIMDGFRLSKGAI